MIEALKLIMIACQLVSPPQFDTGMLSFSTKALQNQKKSLQNQIEVQRQCQKKLIKCWLNNKKAKKEWPLSTCLI